VQHLHHTVNDQKNPLTEDDVKNILNDARARLRNACRDKLLRSDTIAEANLFFGRKAKIIKTEVAQTILDDIQNKINNQESDCIQAVNQIVHAINAIEPPYSNIVFALAEVSLNLEPMLLTMQQTQQAAPQQTLSL
jgi:hypothetical protein